MQVKGILTVRLDGYETPFDGPFARVRFLTSAYGRKTYLSERET
jgi:hypothetical protein